MKTRNRFFGIFEKVIFWVSKIFFVQKWSKMEGFQLVKAPEVTLFSQKPWNLESILLWPKPKNGFLDFWKKSFLESPKTFSAQKWPKIEGFELVKAQRPHFALCNTIKTTTNVVLHYYFIPYCLCTPFQNDWQVSHCALWFTMVTSTIYIITKREHHGFSPRSRNLSIILERRE